MSDFIDAASEIKRTGSDLPKSVRDCFDDVFGAISELQAVHAKSYIDTDNIEALFGAVEMGQLLGKFGARDEEAIARLRQSLATVILVTLERRLLFPVVSHHPTPPKPYDVFVKALKEVKGHEFSFLTFNYDVALDMALGWAGLGFDYCLTESDARPNNPLLKLHGSINWGKCPSCTAVAPFDLGKVRFDIWDDTQKFVRFDLGTKLHQTTHCGNRPIEGPPVLVPPTWNKTYQDDALIRVWRRAAQELQAAENIFVIGYSLPDTDQFFRYLFALGTEGATRLQLFWVFNPDEDGTVVHRYSSLVGRGMEKRFKFERLTFESAIDPIVAALRKP